MKQLAVLTLMLAAGCGFSPTKVRERIVEHKQEAGGKYYALLCQVLEPTNLAGRYDVATTLRSDLITNIDGSEFEVYLNFTMVGSLWQNRPLDYDSSPPRSKSEDFLEMAKRVK